MLIEIPRAPLDELAAFYLRIKEERLENGPCRHQVQHALARELLELRNVGDSLLAPTTTLDQILIVGRKEVLHSSAFADDIAVRQLKILRELRVEAWMVEACFKFTLLNRLAPEWNRVGVALIQGSEFLGDSGRLKLRRLLVEVHCTTSGQMYLKLLPDLCKMFPLEPWQLGRPVQPRWCFMLPKLSRGQVIDVREDLPADSQFADYDELRQYWMDSYGYSLPPAAPPVYFDVVFYGLRNEVFTYPSYCVLTAEPAVYPSDQETRKEIVHDFAEQLAEKMPSVCGQPMLIDTVLDHPPPLPLRTPLAQRNPLLKHQRPIINHMPIQKRPSVDHDNEPKAKRKPRVF
uniref:DUF4708 domain-containing protein n=1 Tax=Plectus sambesii TaxID=2011161 RepID=A0A914XFX5_9BILA